MKTITFLCATLLSVITFNSFASTEKPVVVTKTYVQESIESKVDTSADAKQTLNGEYDVAGVIMVTTPALPSAE